MSSKKRRTEAKEHGRRNQRTEREKLGVGSWKLQLAPLGLQLREVEGDGNCLFRALSDQLTGSITGHLDCRAAVVDFMRRNRADFEPFVEGTSFEEHLQALARPGTWGDNDALVAFSRLHQVNIVVHRLDSPAMKIRGTDSLKARELHVAYHDDLHYSSIRKAGDSSTQPSNIRVQQQQKPEGYQKKTQFEPVLRECDVPFENENESFALAALADADQSDALDDCALEWACLTSLEDANLQAVTESYVQPDVREVPAETQLVSSSRNSSGPAKQTAVRKRDKKREKKQRAAERHRAQLKSTDPTGSATHRTGGELDDAVVIDCLQTLCI